MVPIFSFLKKTLFRQHDFKGEESVPITCHSKKRKKSPLGNLILGIIMLAQPDRHCRSEKQEEQMQHDVASPALHKSHLHSWVVEATLWAGLSTFLGIPPPHSNGSS